MTAIFENLTWTTMSAMTGFALASVIGFSMSVTMLFWKWSGRVIYPMLVVCQSIPIIAVAPLFYVWFGFGNVPRMMVIVIISVFPVAIFSHATFKTIPSERYDILRSLGASRFQTFRKLEWPSVIPGLFTGLRLSAGLSVIGAVIAEITFRTDGIGSYIAGSVVYDHTRHQAYKASLAVSALAILIFMGVSLTGKTCLKHRKEYQR